MDWYATVKRHYDGKRYNVDDVQVFVRTNKISQEQANKIINPDAE